MTQSDFQDPVSKAGSTTYGLAAWCGRLVWIKIDTSLWICGNLWRYDLEHVRSDLCGKQRSIWCPELYDHTLFDYQAPVSVASHTVMPVPPDPSREA